MLIHVHLFFLLTYIEACYSPIREHEHEHDIKNVIIWFCFLFQVTFMNFKVIHKWEEGVGAEVSYLCKFPSLLTDTNYKYFIVTL